MHAVEIIITEDGVRHRLVGQPGDHITKVLAGTKGFYEAGMLRAVKACKRAGVYIDVGAHIGNHSIYFGLHCPATAVIAIEANRATYEVLHTNLLRAGVTKPPGFFELRNQAAWSDSKTQLYVQAGPAGNSGMAHVEPAGHGPCVEAVMLDSVVRSGPVAVIKLDVEGAEIPTLEGAREILRQDRPLLAIEARTPEEFITHREFLTPYGYTPRGPYNATPTYLWDTWS